MLPRVVMLGLDATVYLCLLQKQRCNCKTTSTVWLQVIYMINVCNYNPTNNINTALLYIKHYFMIKY